MNGFLKAGLWLFEKYFKFPSKYLRNTKLDLTGCTPFQLKVYAALRKVPFGKTVTYGELAKQAGHPGAARAVGTAMKKNRLPILIPCHRVIPASGGLGEFSSGKKWKSLLLEQENAMGNGRTGISTPGGNGRVAYRRVPCYNSQNS